MSIIILAILLMTVTGYNTLYRLKIKKRIPCALFAENIEYDTSLHLLR